MSGRGCVARSGVGVIWVDGWRVGSGGGGYGATVEHLFDEKDF